MIDQQARNKLFQKMQQDKLIQSLQEMNHVEFPTNDLVAPLEKTSKQASNQFAISAFLLAVVKKLSTMVSQIVTNMPSKDDMKSLQKTVEDKEFTMPTPLDISPILETLNKLKVSLPSVFSVKGNVKVDNLPSSLEISNFSALQSMFDELYVQISKLKISVNQPSIPAPIVNVPKQDFPSSFEIKNEVQIAQWNELLDAMEELKKGFNLLINKQNAESMDVNIKNFPPRMIPQPVTNVWLNPAQGFMKSTSSTVGTNPVTLPNYGQLSNRRGLMIYNNSANTIYIGGSDVTTSNGIPIAGGTFGPPFDAGYNLQLYAVAATSNNDIRCIEISKDHSDNVQE